VKRAIAELPADALNRLAATCAMHLDQETLKRTGKSPGYAKAVVDELAAERVAKVGRPVVIDHEKVKALRGEGKKYREIAAELGISIASVARILKGRRHE
jgi:hypothetical protein